MRIAMCVHRFPELSQTFVVHQVHALASRGHTVHLFALHRGSPGVLEPRYRYLLSRVRWGRPVSDPVLRSLDRRAYTRTLARGLAPLKSKPAPYDVIHGQFGPDGLRALAMRRRGMIRGPLVTAFQGFDASKVLRAHPTAYRDLAREGELFLPVSAYMRNRLVAAGFDPVRTRVHRSGIPCAEYAFQPARHPGAGDLRLVSCSRLVDKKGLDLALRVVRQLVDYGRRVSYTIIGDGPAGSTLRELARELGLADRVEFTGALPHPQALERLRGAHVLLSPSRTAASGDAEGIPTTIKEAMALGLPVVATDHAGVSELVEHGRTGLLAPEGDASGVGAQVTRLLEEGALWPELTARARRRVTQEYDVELLATQLLEHYRDVIAVGENVS